jgi:hypothetical protein
MTKQVGKENPKCFVIMPISDAQGYEIGHFGRVYEHIIKPAIISAGYYPIRADDTTKTDYIVVGIIQQIVESEILVCDMSARNSNVMYELGIAHAFNKKVVLIKDNATEKVFDVQGLRHSEYDKSLRIDSVHKDISKITSSIMDTCNASDDSMNSIVRLAGIKTAEIPQGQTISADTQLIMSTIASLEKRVLAVDVSEKIRYFKIDDDKVYFQDGSDASINESVYDYHKNEIGTIADIHPESEKIFIKQDDGKIIPYSAYSVRSKGTGSLPF